MKVFISWSGSASKAVAEGLRNWLPMVIQCVTPWVSSEDIARGLRWSAELTRQLETTRVGIICVTRDNMNAPWLLFEAGALSKTTEATFVCPYLLGVEATELTGPLAEFQASAADRDGTKCLLRTVNSVPGNAQILSEKQLDDIFDVWWPRLEPLLIQSDSLLTTEPRQIRTDRDMLREVLELLRAMNRRQSETDGQASGAVTTEVLRSLEEATRLLRLDREPELSPQAIALELAERLPNVLQKSLNRKKDKKKAIR